MKPRPSTIALAEAGAREAAHAIARLLKRPKIPVQSVAEVTPASLIAKYEPKALVVAFTVSGALPGRFAVITSDDSARAIAVELVGTAKSVTGQTKRSMGALTELGNIAASAYLNGVAELIVGSTCVPSVPKCAIDDAHTLVTSAFAGADGLAPDRLIVATLVIDAMTLELVFSG